MSPPARALDRAAAVRGAGRGRAIPRLHVVTDDEVLGRHDFIDRAAALLERCGASVALHVRGPRSSGASVHRAAAALVPTARSAGGRLLVNDRVDVALAAAAHGAHLGRRSLPVGAVRRLLGAGALIGVSVHDAGAAGEAASGGADFLIVGTVYDTPSHPEGSPRGTGVISEARSAAPRLPLLAIGGVTPETVAELLGHGAHGVAVLGGIWHRDDAAAAAASYLEALSAGARNPTDP